MKTDETNKKIVPAAQSQTKTDEPKFHRFLELPAELRQAIIDHDFANTSNIIPFLKRIVTLTWVSQGFSKDVTAACTDKRLRELYDRNMLLFCATMMLSKQCLSDILLNLAKQLVQKNGRISIPDQGLVGLINNFNNTYVNLYNPHKEHTNTHEEGATNAINATLKYLAQIQDLLLPALRTPHPALAHMIIETLHTEPITLQMAMITLAHSDAFEAGDCTSEHQTFLQKMLNSLPEELRQLVITAYATKGVLLRTDDIAGFAGRFKVIGIDCLERNLSMKQCISPLFTEKKIPEMIRRLWRAACKGDSETLNNILTNPLFDKHAHNNSLDIALCCASLHGHVNIAETLMTYDLTNLACSLALRESLLRGHITLAKLLLEKVPVSDIALLLTVIYTYLLTSKDYSDSFLEALCTKMNLPHWMSNFISDCRQGDTEHLISLIKQASDQDICAASFIIAMPLLIGKGYHAIGDVMWQTCMNFNPQVTTLLLQGFEAILLHTGKQQIIDYVRTLSQITPEQQ